MINELFFFRFHFFFLQVGIIGKPRGGRADRAAAAGISQVPSISIMLSGFSPPANDAWSSELRGEEIIIIIIIRGFASGSGNRFMCGGGGFPPLGTAGAIRLWSGRMRRSGGGHAAAESKS